MSPLEAGQADVDPDDYFALRLAAARLAAARPAAAHDTHQFLVVQLERVQLVHHKASLASGCDYFRLLAFSRTAQVGIVINEP
jgi:hypothetical protein